MNAGTTGIHIMGVIGLLNGVFSFFFWFKYLASNLSRFTLFLWSWFVPIVYNGFIWIPLFVIWPIVVTGSASSMTINIVTFLA